MRAHTPQPLHSIALNDDSWTVVCFSPILLLPWWYERAKSNRFKRPRAKDRNVETNPNMFSSFRKTWGFTYSVHACLSWDNMFSAFVQHLSACGDNITHMCCVSCGKVLKKKRHCSWLHVMQHCWYFSNNKKRGHCRRNLLQRLH